MCIGVPEQIVDIHGIAGTTADDRRIDLTLTGPVEPGAWVLTHLGSARAVISAGEARAIQAALDGLARVMAGGETGNAFSDLDNRAPKLPPHLEAARAAGRSKG